MTLREYSALSALVIVLAPIRAEAVDYCHILNVYQPDRYHQGQSISIRAIDTSDLPPATATGESHEDISNFLADSLKKELTASKYFTTVAALNEGQTPATDLVLDGAFVAKSEGSRWQRVVLARAGATLRVRGKLSATRPQDTVVADYECYRENVGGLMGVGGGLTGLFSGGSGNRSNMEKFAKALAGSFKDVERDAAKFAERAKSKKGDPLKGASESGGRKPSANADADDAKDELSTYVVGTNREDWVQADAFWLTAAAHAANQKVNDAQPDAANLTAKRNSVWGGEYGRGFLLDLEPLNEFRGKDVYIIAVTFESSVVSHGPFIWDLRAIDAQTSLSRTDASRQTVKASQILDGPSPSYLINRRFRLIGEILWRSHPTLFVFPTRLPDGSPLISQLDQKVEFRTTVENHPVIITFDTSQLGATTVESLLIGK